jgi:hypothetical protein
VITPATEVRNGTPQRVDISRNLATHSIQFQPTDFQGRPIVPSAIGDARAPLVYRFTHRQTGNYLGALTPGFGQPNRILVSDIPPDLSFSAIGGVGRKFGLPLHLYLYLYRQGIRADLNLTNTAAQLAQREIVAPASEASRFVIPALSFLDYTPARRILPEFPAVGGTLSDFVSGMLGPDGRGTLFILDSADTP